ncbi:MAG: GNAT family N-acetyltransferase [Anaerolineae bacterium]|nr:GNAT family N-acetyltransferase [Anaerolineae bacterium]
MNVRDYDPTKDRAAVLRLWREIGWLREGNPDEALDCLLQAGRTLVSDINGEVECMVATAPGTIQHLGDPIPFSGVMAVCTSLIARRQGLAKRLTARAVAAQVAEGALVSGLGMFDQGYYDQLGFGTGGYEHYVTFDPLLLNVNARPRVPRRLTKDDWLLMHQNRLARLCRHGSLAMQEPTVTRFEILLSHNGFGLGYGDGPNGALTHHFWCEADDLEYGPHNVKWLVYQTREQFLELLALTKSLSDQVRLVRIQEPQGIQLQDYLERPLRQRRTTYRTRYENTIRAVAHWQTRICDLLGCLERTHLRSDTVRFNLRLHDPIERYLDNGASWRGLSGDYVVTLGPSSGAERGTDSTLPTLTASLNAFTRLWLGVRPASGLAYTDDLSGPPGLLEELDWALRLPDPRTDWDI